jgi:hypothetical protein
MLVTIWQYPAFSRPLVLVSLAYPAYYLVLSLVVSARTPRAAN